MSVSGKRVVAFCGAGLSVRDGYPAMSSFNGYLRSSGLLSNDELRAFDAIQAHCTDISALVGGSARNIEQLASLLELMRLSKPTLTFPGAGHYATPAAALALVRKAIALVYSPNHREMNSGVGPLLSNVLEHDNELTVITTNYDLNVEAAAAANEIAVRMTPTVVAACVHPKREQEPRLGSLYSGKLGHNRNLAGRQLTLLKLHGSVNWFNDGMDFRVDDRITGSEYNAQQEKFHRRRWDRGAESWCFPEHTVIIPPTVLKSAFFDAVQEQWQHAADALGQAQVLVFIGYSFPESDTFMRYFMATSLHRNVSIERIIVVDPAAYEIAERIHPLLAHPQHQGLWEVHAMPWERVHLTAALEGGWVPDASDHYVKEVKNRNQVKAVLRGEVVPEDRVVYQRGLRGR
ncbi:MAG TPA: SIR2 family protein [Phycisphaerales bacterium]|nr:SIR2 family protein [Phycisphaerales bacterium]